MSAPLTFQQLRAQNAMLVERLARTNEDLKVALAEIARLSRPPWHVRALARLGSRRHREEMNAHARFTAEMSP